MKILKLKNVKAISKIAQKTIKGGIGLNHDPYDNPIYCYKKCVNSGYPGYVCKKICEL